MVDTDGVTPILPRFSRHTSAAMKVRIDDITSAGIAFDQGVEIPKLDAMFLESQAGQKALDPLTVDLRLSRAGERIIVEGRIATRLGASCKRCLQEVELSLPVEFRMDLLPRGTASSSSERSGARDDGEAERGGSFDLEAADREYYDGESIDVWPILREQLLLALPDYPLCGDECKGLCQSCGLDLNTGECGCRKESPDPRWAALEKIKLT